jgi:choice-of-anchor B domain-containing protein
MRTLFLLLLAAAPLIAEGQISSNMTLLGRWDQRSSYGDIWGYVAPNGDEYALLMSRDDGLSVIDINGTTPVEVGFIPAIGAFHDSKDVETWGTTAYIVNEYANMQVVDLTDPSNPVQVRTFDTQPSGGTGTHTLSIADGYLYVQGGAGVGGVRIFSLANPLNPQFVGDYQPFYVHDVYVRGDVLYAAAIYGEGVDIVDISDKANPQRIDIFNYPGSGAHNVCATEDGAHIFVGDEIGSGNWTRAFNVEDPHDVEQVANIIVNANAVVHNCNVEGDLLYLAHYTEGVRVWDVSDPANPVEVAYYDTYTGSSGGYNGAWSVYPYLPSGKIIASDIQGGLFVLRLDLAAPVAADIEPVGGPIIIPATGGPLSYTAALTNPAGVSQTVDAWVMALLPNGNEYGPVEGPRTLTLAAGQTLGPLTFTETVPGSAPPGVYTVELRVGDYPAGVVSSDSFTFTKATPTEAATAASTAAGASFATHPNPATGRTTVRFALDAAADVRLAVYDALGREVAVLVDEPLPAGPHEAVLDGTALPSGTYLVRLEAGGRVERQTLTLLH